MLRGLRLGGSANLIYVVSSAAAPPPRSAAAARPSCVRATHSAASIGRREVAQAHPLAAAPHLRLIGLGLAGLAEGHAEVARAVLGLEQLRGSQLVQGLRRQRHVQARACARRV